MQKTVEPQGRQSEGTPLSSLASVPVTAETQRDLAGAGLSYFQGMTELEAQSLLALAKPEDEADGPPCFRRQYDPQSPMCAGCLYQPKCWMNDQGYLNLLSAKKAAPPTGVPPEAVEIRLSTFQPSKSRHRRPPRAKK